MGAWGGEAEVRVVGLLLGVVDLHHHGQLALGGRGSTTTALPVRPTRLPVNAVALAPLNLSAL